MGIIIRQTIRGSFWSYLGVGLGFLNIAILSPKVFSTEQIGLTQILIAISVILAQFASLGFNNVTNRLFPYFRDDKNGHNGFLFLALSISFIGFFLVLISLKFIIGYLIEDNLERSPLLSEYAYYLIPLILSQLIFNTLDSYNRVLFNAVLGTFLKEFLVRLLNLGAITLFAINVISFDLYILLYVLIMVVPMIYILIHLIRKNLFNLGPQLKFITPNFRKQILDLCLFGIISGLSGYAISNIDKYMINEYLNLANVGIYSVAFYFGTLILIPSRIVNKIAIPVISEAWKHHDYDTIRSVYTKSSINQFVFGILLFVAIWANIHNILEILPAEYAKGRWVIFFIGCANLLTVAGGVGGQIIVTSKHYRYHTYFMFTLILLVIVTNIIFIPLYGITGAAVATFVASSLYVAIKVVFVKMKMGLQPFDKSHLVSVVIGFTTYWICRLLPIIDNLWYDIILRLLLIVIVFAISVFFLKVSDDLNLYIKKIADNIKTLLRL